VNTDSWTQMRKQTSPGKGRLKDLFRGASIVLIKYRVVAIHYFCGRLFCMYVWLCSTTNPCRNVVLHAFTLSVKLRRSSHKYSSLIHETYTSTCQSSSGVSIGILEHEKMRMINFLTRNKVPRGYTLHRLARLQPLQ
jgi:hypothetical protein